MGLGASSGPRRYKNNILNALRGSGSETPLSAVTKEEAKEEEEEEEDEEESPGRERVLGVTIISACLSADGRVLTPRGGLTGLAGWRGARGGDGLQQVKFFSNTRPVSRPQPPRPGANCRQHRNIH